MLYIERPAVSGMDENSAEHRRQISAYVGTIPKLHVVDVALVVSTTSTAIDILGVGPEFEVLLTPKNAGAAAITGMFAVQTLDTVTLNHSSAAGGEEFSMLIVGPRERSV